MRKTFKKIDFQNGYKIYSIIGMMGKLKGKKFNNRQCGMNKKYIVVTLNHSFLQGRY